METELFNDFQPRLMGPPVFFMLALICAALRLQGVF
jgi:hypothetical protein